MIEDSQPFDLAILKEMYEESSGADSILRDMLPGILAEFERLEAENEQHMR
jgi:hypothetical protein